MATYRGSDFPPSYEQSGGGGGGGGGDCKKSPLPPSHPQPPHQQPPPPVMDASGRQRYGGRMQQIYLSWVPVTKGGQIPPRAVEGRDSAGIFIGRARHGYQLLPGKAAGGGHRCCYAAHGGLEVKFQEYEVLCDSSIDSFGHVAYDWFPCDGASTPSGALAGGCTDTGEPLFVARGSVGGERVFGYAQMSQRCACFPWGGQEHRSSDFEVMVLR